ncbi:hypothetical protein D3C71_1898150 [compost metagenome]
MQGGLPRGGAPPRRQQRCRRLGLREAAPLRRQRGEALGAFTRRMRRLRLGGAQALEALHGILQSLPVLGADRKRQQAALQLLLPLLALGQKLPLPAELRGRFLQAA